MRPYYKITSLIKLADGFLNFMRDPASKDFDDYIVKLTDTVKGANQVISLYPKSDVSDNYIVQIPQTIQLHQLLLQIIDVCELVELNLLKSFVLHLSLTPDGYLTQWNNAGTTLYNILNAGTTLDNILNAGTTLYNIINAGTTLYNILNAGTTLYNVLNAGTIIIIII